MKWKAPWVVPWILAMVMIVASPVLAQGVEIINFEAHPANPSGTPGVSIDPDFYRDRGVRFQGGTVLQYEDGFTSSGRNGLEMCYSLEFCAAPFQIDFDARQQRVAVQVGYSGTLDEPARVMMIAFDSDGARLDVAELTLQPDSPVPVVPDLILEELILVPDSPVPARPALAVDDLILVWDSPVPVGTELAVQDLAGRIAAVEIRWSDATRIMNSLVIDDLLFEPFVPVVEFSVDPIPFFVESIEPVVEEIVVTHIGNVAVSFFVTLGDPVEAFELIGTTCEEGLAPGESCALQIYFGPSEAGDYTSKAVLRDPAGRPIFDIEVSGTRPFLEVTTTTVTPPTTAPPPTVAPTTVPRPTVVPTTAVATPIAPRVPEAAPIRPSLSDGAGGSDTMLILFLVGAIGGGALLIWRW